MFLDLFSPVVGSPVVGSLFTFGPNSNDLDLGKGQFLIFNERLMMKE